MSLQGWLVFASFWVFFVTTPGPNAVNCMTTGMQVGFRRGLWAVAGILTQAALFLTLSAAGIAAFVAASPGLYGALRLAGAAVLVGLGLRTLWLAGRPVRVDQVPSRSIYLRALAIATFNAKSLAGYLAAFTQFVQPDVPVMAQMGLIYPTALTITAASYSGYVALGTGLGRAALGAVLNVWFRRLMGVAFVGYGLALALSGWG
ncbi:LysE family translocator [Aliigemmobacter aestuarii]|uniref:LysE family translocator n=1 Tax=Aliigemmobacter aestuarii TaxID=1445661 RepID=A0A4S3MML9_9RHOB|nr:LysE family translocator [Gemmobacter aestuarii]THD83680.1 LysE family translocator [Gemmobacter aestuarii]